MVWDSRARMRTGGHRGGAGAGLGAQDHVRGRRAGIGLEERRAGPRAEVPGRPREPSRLPHRVVVLHRQPLDRRGAPLRLPAHVLPRRRQRRAQERVALGRARPVHGAPRRDRHREGPPRLGREACASRRRHCRRDDRYLPGLERVVGRTPRGRAAQARGRVVRAAHRHRLHARRRQAARAAGRSRLQPEGGDEGQRLALLLADPHADAGHDHARQRPLRGRRRELDGPRVRYELPRSRADRMGLVRAAARRSHRSDALRPAVDGRPGGSALERDGDRRVRPGDTTAPRGLHARARAHVDVGGHARRLSRRVDGSCAGIKARAERAGGRGRPGDGRAVGGELLGRCRRGQGNEGGPSRHGPRLPRDDRLRRPPDGAVPGVSGAGWRPSRSLRTAPGTLPCARSSRDATARPRRSRRRAARSPRSRRRGPCPTR